MTSSSGSLRSVLGHKVLVADGAMGTMLQAYDLDLDEFQGYEGCNEILNVTRPDVVKETHQAYLAVGVDAIETNTFGANYANLLEYDIPERIEELAKAGARVARIAADEYSTPEKPRFVFGSMGPGTKLPTLGHAPFATLRDAFATQSRGLLEGGCDALLVETVQDVLQAKAAIIGAQRAMSQTGIDVPIMVHVTVETTGTMLLGTEVGGALTALGALGVDSIGLNCATGPSEMTEHLRHLSAHSPIPVTVMPNAGLPEIGPDGVVYPLGAEGLATALTSFVEDYGLSIVGGCCGTTPEHLEAVVKAVAGRPVSTREPVPEQGVSSLYHTVPFQQDASYLAIGERTNANGSKAFREAMLAGDYETCLDIARGQTRDGAHLLDLCVDYVGRDGIADIRELAGRFATGSTLPLVIDSTEPDVIEAGLEMLGGRSVVNSVNYEDGDGPESRFQRIMRAVSEHGAAVVALTIDEEGQARTTTDKVRIASRLIEDLTTNWGMNIADIIVDCLTFPIATGQEETRRDGIETLDAIEELKKKYPEVQTTLGLSNISFGLNPAARQVLNSVFLNEASKRGLDSAIVHASKIVPLASIDEKHVQLTLDLIYDRRQYDENGVLTVDPLAAMMDAFSGVDAASVRDQRAAALAAMPLNERLAQRIIDGETNGLTDDLDDFLAEGVAPLEIINSTLLAGMKTVGELFGSGQMQLPFVLQSAEAMKQAVAHLEPAIEAQMAAEGQTERSSKATMVLATVRGDVHDIGKNLVDIILSNNGYEVINIGIKQPISEILKHADAHNADAIGMSGLLVKSTMIMRDNLEEINSRNEGARWPIILGGAALTRAYVEQDLADIYDGEVRYARDAFEGLRLMDAIAAAKSAGEPVGQHLPALRERRVKKVATPVVEPSGGSGRSDVARGHDVPKPPFWGSRVVKGIQLAHYAKYLDERATFLGQWGLKPTRGGDGPGYDELVETEGRPRLRMWMDRLHTESILQAAVVYGYFPCWSEGDDLVIAHHEGNEGGHEPGTERLRITYPRQTRDRRLCVPDFFRDKEEVAQSGQFDVVPFQLVTMGGGVDAVTADLFARDNYRDYLELHGLTVQLTEALAEMWHARVREELGLGQHDDGELAGILRQGYSGSRYSFGYPACPSLEDRRHVITLLEPERIGVTLSEELQLHPEQSTDAFVVHHREAKYFNAG